MSETSKELDNVESLTKEQTDTWIDSVLQEYDWLSKDKQKICDELKIVQEKLRPLEDEYNSQMQNHERDGQYIMEIKHKISVLQAKLKQLYELYRK
jgi:DNA repair exonuclease SbcCD ATPase subunit